MQAILTKILPATNTQPRRIKASCARGSITICEDGSSESNHGWAATKLCSTFVAEDSKEYGTPPEKNPWAQRRVMGCLPNGDYAHVFVTGKGGAL